MSKSIAERIEALEGPCREMEAEIYSARNPHMKPVTPVAKYRGRFFDPSKTTNIAAQSYHISGGATGIAPRYTTSLDAAMTLVPEGWLPIIDCTYIRPEVELHPTDESSFGQGRRFGKAATPALALCAAALRAQEATNG